LLPELSLSVSLEAAVSPSEDPAKVLAAMERVLAGSKYTVEKERDEIQLRSRDPRALDALHDQLRDRHVRSSARRLLLVGRNGDSSTVMLNRQAAAVGVIALCGSEGESPLGPILLRITSSELDAIFDWLTAYKPG